MSFGVKISVPGVDVKTATPEQCVVHSAYPHLKVFGTGVLNYTTVGDPTETFGVTHNLGYKPSFHAYINRDTDPADTYLILPVVGAADGISISSTNTDLTVTVTGYSAGVVMIVKYYIFYDPAA